MDNVKMRLMSSILHFLRGEFRAGYLDPENAEGLEVAIHCLENIYDVNLAPKSEEEPPLLDIYKNFLSQRNVINCKEPTEEQHIEAEHLKVEGNVAMSAGKYSEAVELYSRAIDINQRNAVYYCNRAAAKSKLNDHVGAIADCKIAIDLDPKYSKAYGRLGLAYCGLESYANALENYKKAYDLEPDNEGYRKNFELAQQKVAELCCCAFDDQSRANSNAQNTSFAGTNPSNATNDTPNPLGSGLDLNMVFGNQQLVNIATQMLSDPAMQNMMSSIMNQDTGNGMQALLQAGQTLARQMQSENPNFFNQLRQSFGQPSADATNLPPREGNNRPDSGQDRGESSREKQQ